VTADENISRTYFLYLLTRRLPPSEGLRLFFEPNLFTNSTFSTAVALHAYPPMKMEQTERSETLAFKLQTPGNSPEESMTFKTRRRFKSAIINT
jgi:hypothetical protein